MIRIIPSGINPSIGIGSTQGQRKTMTRLGFELREKFVSIERICFPFRRERVLPRFQGFSPSLCLKRLKRAVGNMVKEYT